MGIGPVFAFPPFRFGDGLSCRPGRSGPSCGRRFGSGRTGYGRQGLRYGGPGGWAARGLRFGLARAGATLRSGRADGGAKAACAPRLRDTAPLPSRPALPRLTPPALSLRSAGPASPPLAPPTHRTATAFACPAPFAAAPTPRPSLRRARPPSLAAPRHLSPDPPPTYCPAATIRD